MVGAYLRGSLSAAFAMFPPAAVAIPAMSRLDTTERGFSDTTSDVLAYRSRCLMRSQDARSVLSGLLFVRTKTQEPRNFFPCNENFNSPLRRPDSMSVSGIHVPWSHTMTV